MAATTGDWITQGVLAVVTVMWAIAVGTALMRGTAVDPQIHAAFLLVAGGTLTARGALKRGNGDT